MWFFRRKPRNRRNERGRVLEVKMRSRVARNARLRAVSALVAVLGGTVLGALLVWQAYQWALQRFVYANDAYAIRRIELRHEGRLRSEQILRWAGVETGQNLLAIDLDRIRRDLEMNPWIARAEVEALRPDCLRLVVYEREPVGQVVIWRLSRTDGHAWPETNLVDATGFVMPPPQPEALRPGVSADFTHLTRLVGLDHAEVFPGQRLGVHRDNGVAAALALIRAYEDSSMYSLADLDLIDVANRETLQGVLRQGTRVIFGVDGFERQMLRWRSIHEHSRQVGRELAWLDLSVTNNVPARWMTSTNAPVTPRSTKPPRPGKRHV